VPRGLESVYLISLGEGLLVGVIYSLVNGGTARHPARRAEHSGGKAVIAGTSLRIAWQQLRCTQHLFGAMPRHAEPRKPRLSPKGGRRGT
jgi:xanthosine utilization system XapX-like protein